jgi:hypothetical protein
MVMFSRQLNVRPGQFVCVTVGDTKHVHKCGNSAKLLVEVTDADGEYDPNKPNAPTAGGALASMNQQADEYNKLPPATQGMKVR